MKAFAGMIVLSLAVPIMAQQQVTPPAVPNIGAPRPQPGIAAGATGGVGIPATGRTPLAIGPTVPGRATVGPPPVLMTPDQLVPQYPFPLLLPDPYVELPPAPAIGQGRPGGLGVTITGGDTNAVPPPTPPPADTTNSPPAVTNPPPTNATNGTNPNTPPPFPPY